MKFVNQLLAGHLGRYPQMELDDIYKLLHQAAMGPGHAIHDAQSARSSLLREIEQLGEGLDEPLVDPISPEGQLARVHLRTYVRSGRSADMLLEAFLQTARLHQPAQDKLVKFLGCLGDLADAKGLPFTRAEVERYCAQLEQRSYPVIHHSAAFREAYRPSYRVVRLDCLNA